MPVRWESNFTQSDYGPAGGWKIVVNRRSRATTQGAMHRGIILSIKKQPHIFCQIPLRKRHQNV
jgi:hypothetical protein